MKEYAKDIIEDAKIAIDGIEEEIIFLADEMNDILDLGMKTDDERAVEEMADKFDAMNHQLIRLEVAKKELQNILALARRMSV